MSGSWKRRVIACSVGGLLAIVVGVTNADPRWLYAIVVVTLGVYIWLYDRAYRRGDIPGPRNARGTRT